MSIIIVFSFIENIKVSYLQNIRNGLLIKVDKKIVLSILLLLLYQSTLC